MRRLLGAALATLVTVAVAQPVTAEVTQVEGEVTEYVVVLDEGVSTGEARAAIEAAGGTVVGETPEIGAVTVRSSAAGFAADVAASAAVEGAARNRPLGQAMPTDRQKDDVEQPTDPPLPPATVQETPDAPGADPLFDRQWYLRMIEATPDGSYATQAGDPRVRVGIIDTGVDASHPDIAPRFDHELSRNFTVDIPLVDGPCEEEPDQSCLDPADVDESGHGTHVAGIVAAPVNGIGTSGVAPEVTVVNLRAGQDSGYFFLQPVVDALIHAADNGIDVVTMSFYIDPWLFNCPDHPADSPEAQLEQQTIIAATTRALEYAHAGGVTLVSSMGNEAVDLGDPEVDPTSPDFPPGNAYEREVDNTCLTLPTEGPHALNVTAVGPSTRKAYYSSYGVEQADVAAPGGDFYDFPGTDRFRTPENQILAPYPESVAREQGLIGEDGEPTSPFLVRDCADDVCGYYRYLQGTSMAGPVAAGVAAVIVSQYGVATDDGVGLDPDVVEAVLESTATDRPCPADVVEYPELPANYAAPCEGTFYFNGFYGEGIVNARRAVHPFWAPVG